MSTEQSTFFMMSTRTMCMYGMSMCMMFCADIKMLSVPSRR